MKKAIIAEVAIFFGVWILGEIVMRQVISPDVRWFVRIGLLAVAAVLGIGTAETMRQREEEQDE